MAKGPAEHKMDYHQITPTDTGFYEMVKLEKQKITIFVLEIRFKVVYILMRKVLTKYYYHKAVGTAN